jgi:hypothetical protein
MCFAGPPICLIFSLSFFVPLCIGIYCIETNKKMGRYRFSLGLLSIIIGIVLGFINIGIVSKYWIFYDGFESRVVFITVMVDLALIPTIFYGISWIVESKKDEKHKRLLTNILVGLVILILIITVVGANLIKVTKTPIKYSYEINTYPEGNQSYSLYLPIPLDEFGHAPKFMNNVKVSQGSGIFSVEQTQHGWALNLSSNGPIRLTVSGASKNEPFNSLSLQNSSKNRDLEFWVYHISPANQSMRFVQQISRHAVGDSTDCRINGTIGADGWTIVEGGCSRHVV